MTKFEEDLLTLNTLMAEILAVPEAEHDKKKVILMVAEGFGLFLLKPVFTDMYTQDSIPCTLFGTEDYYEDSGPIHADSEAEDMKWFTSWSECAL